MARIQTQAWGHPEAVTFSSEEALGKTAMQTCNQLLDSILCVHTHTF